MKKVLYIVDDKESAQFRYRVQNVGEALVSSEKWGARVVLRTEINKDVLKDVSLIIIVRQTAKDSLILDLIKQAKQKRIKVLFDLDDLVFDYRDLRLLMKAIKARNVFYWIGYFWGIRRIAKRVDGFLTTNEFLAGMLKRSFNRPVKIIPNSLNREQVEGALKLVKKKGQKDGEFTIGYFSGSPTHANDFKMVEPELIRFLEAHSEATLGVVGYMNFSREMERMIAEGKVKNIPLVDYLKLQELVSEVDVNIAPLVINDFTNCKSELKFFEAAIVETTTIASPTYTFKKAITDGKNGYLAQPGEWYDKLEYLYKNPKKNREVALAAKDYALKHYYGKEFLKEVEAAYDYFAG